MNNMNVKNNVVFLDSTQGFPVRFSACNTKVEYIAKGLIEQGDRAVVINECKGEKGYNSLFIGKHKNIYYYLLPQKYKSLIKSTLLNIKLVFKILKKNKINNMNNFVFIDYNNI
ncbi:hypothetical protein, partial [Formosa sp. S-31]|uniref:hypothetical protein n=1 Tax=Formosa sp. S-31 TaxID=2790949 RepID=UPI003EB6B1D1